MSETTETASVSIDILKARLAELEEAQRKEGEAIQQESPPIAPPALAPKGPETA